ncbi:UNVERIFIED_CONTAM: hypothetical protein Sradi_2946400 [Sesamum radiatum]|uniref:SWIM-type domain-containing protein n=1 Tax=Sesamum radiatum TaxID=300843 RepID=A0AAW2RZ24_SESRA
MDNQQWADYAFRLFEARQAEAIHHIVQKFDYNQQSASVITLSTTGQGSRTYVVKLRQQMCSCGKWATHGIPCSHAIQASRHFGMNASNFIPQYFSTRAYKKTYLERFEPVYGRSIGIPFILSLCIIRPSELAEDRDEMSQREYETKWINHRDVPANNIKLTKLRFLYIATFYPLHMSPSATTWTTSVSLGGMNLSFIYWCI